MNEQQDLEPIEKECDCCGWDDSGYQHEPYCSTNSDLEDVAEEASNE